MRCPFHAVAMALSGLALTVVTLVPVAEAAVLRCRTADGRVLYQDTSCPDGARGESVDATPNRGFRFATPEEIARAKRPPPEEIAPRARAPKAKAPHARRAGERRFIVTGMSGGEIRRKYGAPDEIVHPSSDTGKKRSRNGVATRQWVYLPAPGDPQTTTVLTVRGNMVVHVDRRVTYESRSP